MLKTALSLTSMTFLALAMGCGTDDGGDAGTGGDGDGTDGPTCYANDSEQEGGVDVDLVETVIAELDSDCVTKINSEHFTTTHGLGDSANLYVSTGAVSDYESIDPANAAASSGLSFAEGTLIIKEHTDADGAPNNSYTFMIKAEAGYDAEHNDWYWGRTSGGSVTGDSGINSTCYGCHSAASESDWVYGHDEG